jgi:hypothetical protein
MMTTPESFQSRRYVSHHKGGGMSSQDHGRLCGWQQARRLLLPMRPRIGADD